MTRQSGVRTSVALILPREEVALLLLFHRGTRVLCNTCCLSSTLSRPTRQTRGPLLCPVQMIKFTSFGIPYLTEFENVSFVPGQRPPRSLHTPSPSPSPSPSSSSSSFCYIESPPPPPRLPSLSLRLASSLFKRKPAHSPNGSTTEPPTSEDTKPLPPPPQSDTSETHGIYIQLPPELSHPQMTRKQRLVHLQKTISVAVLDAGMSSSPGNTTPHSNENALQQARGYKTANALFCGTYGQLMTALEAAGLSAIPYVGEGLSGCA